VTGKGGATPELDVQFAVQHANPIFFVDKKKCVYTI